MAQTHKDTEDKYHNAVKKAMCRILSKREEDMQILPAYLDQWKKYTQMRKIWKRVIRDCEIRLDRDHTLAAKLWAFRRLQYTHDDREKFLMGKPLR